MRGGGSAPLWAYDCNNNGIADHCDLSCAPPGCNVPGCGTKQDCNNNAVPDECDIMPLRFGAPAPHPNQVDATWSILVGQLGCGSAVDILAGVIPGSNTFKLLQNNNDGSFCDAVNFYQNSFPGGFGLITDTNTPPDGCTEALFVFSPYNQIFKVEGFPSPTVTTLINLNAAGGAPLDLCVADLDGDTLLDVAVTHSGPSRVSIWRNQVGSWTWQNNYPVSNAGAIACADFDGDGDVDIATASGGAVSVLRNNGFAMFTPVGSFSCPGGAAALQAARIDSQAFVDLAVIGDMFGVLHGNGDCTFSALPMLYSGGGSDLSSTDLDGNGATDFVSPSHAYLNDGNAVFTPLDFGIGNGAWVDTGDIDGDGDPDVVVGVSSGQGIQSPKIFVVRNLARAYSKDCNTNTIPDECDIAGGTSMDADVNRVPDECEQACVPREYADVFPCEGDGFVNADDVLAVLDTFADDPPCPDPCAP